MLVGLVIVLMNLGDPSAIGRAMAVALIPQSYGLLLAYGILLPVVASLKRRLEEAEE